MKRTFFIFMVALISTFSSFAVSEKDLGFRFMNKTEKNWLAKVESSINPESDYIMLTGYMGKDSVFVIPKEIEGYSVISSTIIMVPETCKKVIVPETLVYLHCPYYYTSEHPGCVIELSGKRNTKLLMDGNCFQYFKTPPMSTRILVHGNINFGNVKSITWSKNWTTNPHLYYNGLDRDENQYPSGWQFYKRKQMKGIISSFASELTNTGGFTHPHILDLRNSIKEFIFEEGCEEVTPVFLNNCLQLERIVIPKSMKFIYRGKATYYTLCSDMVKGPVEIEIATGCQVVFEMSGQYSYIFPENKISIRSRKRLQEVGYKFS